MRLGAGVVIPNQKLYYMLFKKILTKKPIWRVEKICINELQIQAILMPTNYLNC